jgi:hypothetical protein
MSEQIKTRYGAMAKPVRVLASSGKPINFTPTPTKTGAPVSAINETPPPTVGASATEIRAEIAASKARIAALNSSQDPRVAASAVPKVHPVLDPIDLALEAAFPAFPDEVAQVKATETVRAAAAPGRGGVLPGAREACGQQYYAATGRTWTVQASAQQDAAPEAFAGSGDIPAATASGMDPALLSKARWQDRWQIAKAPSQAEAAQLLNQSIEFAKDFGDVSAQWPPTGLDDDAAAYVNAYSRHLSGFPAAGSNSFGRMSG